MRKPNELTFPWFRALSLSLFLQDSAGGASSADASFSPHLKKLYVQFITFQTRTKRLLSGKMPTANSKGIQDDIHPD